MPKKIPDLEAKILEIAGTLFLSKGYNDVDMKTIAVAAGTSVGNLYNYFPSKTELFLTGSIGWWKNLHSDFAVKAEGIKDVRKRLDALLFHLMETMEKHLGLWEEFLAASSRELSRAQYQALQDRFKEGGRTMIELLDELLAKVAVGNPRLEALQKAPGYRMASSMVALVKMLSRRFPGEGEENRAFVRLVLDSFLQ